MALVAFGAVVLAAWALGLEDISSRTTAGAGTDPAESLARLAGGTQDTARVATLGLLSGVVNESSGVAVSRTSPGVVWTHNDGSEGRLHAVREEGDLLASVAVDGVDVVDWEDIAAGPCPDDGPEDRDCLYLGDIGDNDARRRVYGVDIIPEPEPRSGSRATLLRRVRFRYPDGPSDTEALALAPTGDVLLVTKGNDGAARLYRLPVGPGGSAPDEVRVAEPIGTLRLDVSAPGDRVTGAAVSPDGSRLAVRNHHAVYLVPVGRPLGTPVVCEIGIPQPQGEAVDFLTDDTLILTSEGPGGPAPVVRLRCP